MKSGIHMTKNRLGKVMKTIATLPAKRVLVGIPSEDAERQHELVKKKPGSSSRGADGLNNAALGYIHNYGAPEANIPARPFMEPGIRDVKDKIEAAFTRAGKAALAGNATGVDAALHAAGMAAMSGIQRRITTGPFKPLAASTISRRRRRGRTGTKPLIDTGQLRRSITYVIRPVRVSRFGKPL